MSKMPKRRRTSDLDSEGDGSDFEGSKSCDDSDFRDASFGKKTKKRVKKQHMKKKGVVRPRSVDVDEVDTDIQIHVSTHSKSTHIISSPGPMRVALLRWYRTVHDTRRMPWRKPYNPSSSAEERAQRAYEVWVSEIMLQQTQVATVIPYYTRWMEKYPTIRHLASANIDQVNALWKGLGYYSRASRLLAGAQKAIQKYGGRLPDNAKEMEANIPGIGRYSAGAICSIAYGEKVPVLDGNVHRLLSRVLALHASPKAKSTLDILWGAATVMVQFEEADTTSPPQYTGDINQALIELGSTVCKVRDPECGTCPIQNWCSAYQNSESKESAKEDNTHMVDIEDICGLCEPLTGNGVMSYPMKAERKKAREELDIVNVVEWRPIQNSDERWFLFRRRPSTGLLAGLYEFPTSPAVSKTISHDALKHIPYNLISQVVQDARVFPLSTHAQKSREDLEDDCEDLHLRISKIKFAGDVVHLFSHVKKTYRAQWVLLEGGSTPPTLKSNLKVEIPIKKSGKRKTSPAAGGPDTESPAHAMWVLLDDVADVNMGTGVAKVWNLTQALWGKNIDGD